MIKTVLKRFARGFAASFVSILLMFLTSGTPPKDFTELTTLIFPVLIAALTGGLLAIDKVLRWEKTEP